MILVAFIVGLFAGMLIALFLVSVLGSATQADLESDKWRLEQKVSRLEKEAVR